MTSWISSTPETVFRDMCSAPFDQRIALLPDEPLVIIVPTSRQRDELLIRWARQNGRGEPPMILTMAGFYRALAHQVLPEVPRLLSDSSVDVLLRHAADSCDLPPGSVRLRASRIVRWAQELRSPAWLRDASSRHPSRRNARHLEMAARIWEAYEGLLGSRAADRGTMYRRVTEALRHRSGMVLTTTTGDVYSRCLVIDTHGVTGVDAQLLQTLATGGWDIAVQFAPELVSTEYIPMSRTARDIQWFVAQGWHLGAQTDATLPVAERCLVPCMGRTDEVRRAVAVCKEAAATGVSLGSMAICVPGDPRYIERLQRACSEAGLPVQATREIPVSTTHAASLLYACCRVVTDGWLRSDLERVLREPLLRDIVHFGPSLLLIARRERIVGGGGADEWIDRIEQRYTDMCERAERSDDASDHAQRNAQRYAYALRSVRDLRTMLDVNVHGLMTAEQFTSILLNRIASGIQLEHRSAEHEPGAFDVLRDACSAYSALHRDHELPNSSFASHLSRWWMLVRSETVALAPRSTSGVRIARPAELRGRQYELVVAVGCIEGEFPRTSVQQLDEDVVPDVQKHLAWESMADIAYASADAGTTLFLFPTVLDGSPVLASTTLDALSDQLTKTSRWRSADPNLRCIVHRRDLSVDASDIPVIDRSQLGDVRKLHHAEAQRTLDEDLSRPVSPSRLDLVMQCPYRFFAQRILRLDDLDIDDAQLSPMERGTLLHDVVDRWYRRLRSNDVEEITPKALMAGCIDLSASSFSEQWSLLTDVVDEVLSEQSHIHALAPVERRAIVGDHQKPGLLQRWLALEREDQRKTGFMPVLFELNIEVKIDVPTAEGTISVPVNARIDRIDILVANGEFRVSVVDYKSSLSSLPSAASVQAGLASQMPIYLLAVKEWFAQHGMEVHPEAAAYRAFGTQLQAPDNLDRRVVLADAGSAMVGLGQKRPRAVNVPLSDTLQDIMVKLAPGIAEVQSGIYPVRPLPGACRTCGVSEVCRRDQWGVLEANTGEEIGSDEESIER